MSTLADQYAALMTEGTALAAKSETGDLTPDEETRWDALSGEIKAVVIKLDSADQRKRDAADWKERGDRLARDNESRGRVSALVPVGAGVSIDARYADRREAQRIQTLGERVIASEGYQQFKARNWTGNSGAVPIRSLWKGPIAGNTDGLSADEQYALVRSGALPTDMIAPQRLPGVYGPDPAELTVRSAFLNIATNAAVITFYRELARTNAATWVAEAAVSDDTSGTKPESGITWERGTSVVEVLATYFPVTNQLLEDDPAMRGILEGVLLDMLREVEDVALLTGSGTPPAIRGLLNTTGIQEADATYYDDNPVAGAGEANEDFDRLLRARRLVRQVGRKTPTFYIVHPADMERFISTVDADRQYYAGGPFAAGPVPTVWRLPVIESEAMPEGEFICGAGRAAIVFDRMDAAVTTGWIDKQFVRNMITMLAEERITLVVPWPLGFVHGEFVAAAAP